MRPGAASRRVTVLVAAAVLCGAALALAGATLDRASTGESAQPAARESAQADLPPGAELPAEGLLRFGQDLGGVALGASRDEVVAAWGAEFGTCRACAEETWYFTYKAFAPEGIGVEFADDRVQALFTLWKPPGWRSAGGLELGISRDAIPSDYLDLRRIECSAYEAYIHERGDDRTVIYLSNDMLWAFALLGPAAPVCR